GGGTTGRRPAISCRASGSSWCRRPGSCPGRRAGRWPVRPLGRRTRAFHGISRNNPRRWPSTVSPSSGPSGDVPHQSYRLRSRKGRMLRLARYLARYLTPTWRPPPPLPSTSPPGPTDGWIHHPRRQKTMYHFAVVALLALAVLKVADLLEDFVPGLARMNALLTYVLAVAAAVAL